MATIKNEIPVSERVRELERELEAARNERDRWHGPDRMDLIRQRDMERAQRARIEQELVETQQQRDTARATVNQYERLRGDQLALRQQRDHAQAANVVLMKEKQQLSDERAAAERLLAEATAEVARLEEQCAGLIQSRDGWEREAATYADNAAHAQRQRDEVKQELEAVKEHADELQRSVDALEEQAADVQSDLDRTQARLKNTQETLAEVRAERDALAAELKEVQRERDRVANELGKLRDDCAMATGILERRENQLLEQRTAIGELRKALLQLPEISRIHADALLARNETLVALRDLVDVVEVIGPPATQLFRSYDQALGILARDWAKHVLADRPSPASRAKDRAKQVLNEDMEKATGAPVDLGGWGVGRDI